jgi:hypothetical protein
MRRRKSSAREALEAVLFCAAIAALFAMLPLEPPAKADAGVAYDSLAILGRQGGSPPGPASRKLRTEAQTVTGDGDRLACELPRSSHAQSALPSGEC